MRLFYFLFYLIFNPGFRLFFKRVRIINFSRIGEGRTIFVSNHPAAFMDPLAIAIYCKNVFYFMVRADVFKPLFKPVFSLSHMIPIYRQLDGGDTQEKNRLVFRKTSEIIRKGKNILIFGEGFTDEVFIRRIKPIKKGAFRIGFSALEEMNWEHKVCVVGLGCNYTEPNWARSELLISSSRHICLNDYRKEYENNPSGIISLLTKQLEQYMKDQITHVENIDWLEFHEQCMMISRNGMNIECFNENSSLEERHMYSQVLAKKINEKSEEQLANLEPLKAELVAHFSSLSSAGITENERFLTATNTWGIGRKLVSLFLIFPFALFGFVHAGWLYFLVKRFVEKVFARPVFWGSSKLVILIFALGIFNIPFIFLIANYFSFLGVNPTLSLLIGLSHYCLIAFYGLAFYNWKNQIKTLLRYFKVKKIDLRAADDAANRLLQKVNSI